ncbi:MAG: 1-acyl-sn-glycerol-3-phosphate acyltransferase [Acidimicrobiia bacterium]|nr:1-acyl-sn-glycerol-3-phosphate acyltransferase [Acidimicrobiia bacterium]
MTPRFVLPGGRFGCDSPADLVRLAFGAGWVVNVRGRIAGKDLRRWSTDALSHLRVRLTVDGLEHIEPETTYVVVANHESFLDPVALLQLPIRLGFVARDELLEWPILDRYLGRDDHIVLCPERGLSALRVLLNEGARILGEGTSLVAFPQGTMLGIETAFSVGPFELAMRENVAVLPVALSGGHNVWEYPFSPTVRYGRDMTMSVLQPIMVEAPYRNAEEVSKTIKSEVLPDPATRRFKPEIDGFWDGYRYEIDPSFPELAETVASWRAGDDARRRQSS